MNRQKGGEQPEGEHGSVQIPDCIADASYVGPIRPQKMEAAGSPE